MLSPHLNQYLVRPMHFGTGSYDGLWKKPKIKEETTAHHLTFFRSPLTHLNPQWYITLPQLVRCNQDSENCKEGEGKKVQIE